MNIGNLQAGESATITIRYAELHHWQNDQLRFFLPTVITERYGSPTSAGLKPHEQPETDEQVTHHYKMALHIHGSLSTASLESPTHTMQTTYHEKGVTLIPAEKTTFLDRDFILNIYRHEEIEQASSLFMSPDPFNKGKQVVLVSFQPNFSIDQELMPNTNIKIIVDCSGSMEGDSIRQAREALLAIIDTLSEHDTFTIIRFGNHTETLGDEMRFATAENLAIARRYIQKTRATLGGTEIANALNVAYATHAKNNDKSDILLITDGQVWNHKRIVKQAVSSGHRIFSVGVGSAVSESFIQTIAEKTGGTSELVTPNEDMPERIVRHFQRIVSGANISIDWRTTCLIQSPKRLKKVSPVDTVHAFCISNTSSMTRAESVVIDYQYGEKHIPSQIINKSSISASFSPDLLARMAANERLNEINNPAEETKLAIKYQLLTKRTGMLIVAKNDNDKQYIDLPELRKVPQMKKATFVRSSTTRASCSYYLDIPAFLRDQADGADDAIKEPVKNLSPSVFVSALDKKLPKETFFRQSLLWSIDYLQALNLPNNIVQWLRSFISTKIIEEHIVQSFLYALSQSIIGKKMQRDSQRMINKAYKNIPQNVSLDQAMHDFFLSTTENEWSKKI